MRKLVYGFGSALVLTGVLMTLVGSAQARRAANAPTPPTQGSCKPETFSMTDGSQHYPVEFSKFVPPDPKANPYQAECIWVLSSDQNEAFTVQINFQPPDTYGQEKAGNCDGSKQDHEDGPYTYAFSQTRHLDVDGADKRWPWYVEGGNLKSVTQEVLKAAEGEGVGLPCTSAMQLPTQKPQSEQNEWNKQSNVNWGFVGLFTICAATFTGPAALAAGVAGGIVSIVAAYDGYQAVDPPDPHFKAIARPKVGRWPRVSASGKVSAATAAALNALSQNGARLLALHRAELTAVERSQGAAAAGSAAWTKKQSLAAADYADQLAAAYRRQAALLARLPLPPKTFGAKLTAAQVRALQRDAAAHGLPARLTTTLRRFGLRPADLAPLRSKIARLKPAAATRSLPAIVHDRAMTRTLNANADAFKRYAKAIRAALGIHP